MIGRRCETGCETWPDDDFYTHCPKCGDETTRYRFKRESDVLDHSEAAHIAFEKFYEEWDKRPKVRLQETPEEKLRWDSLYPEGAPDADKANASG